MANYVLTALGGTLTISPKTADLNYPTPNKLHALPGALAITGVNANIYSRRYDTVAESLKLHNDVALAWAPPALTSTVGITQTLTPVVRFGAAISERLGLDDTLVVNQKLGQAIAEVLGLTQSTSAGWPLTLTSTIGLTQAIANVRGVIIMDALGLHDAWATQAKYYQTILEQLALDDTFAAFFTRAINETLQLGQTVVPTWQPTAQINEALILGETTAAKLLIRVDMEEGIGFDDSQVLKMIFNGVLTDGIQLSAAYISPQGTFTTWAVNGRTEAVTEYQNYEFNSFGKVGKFYAAASSDGIYALDGERDGTTNIVARIKSGISQMNRTRLHGFAGAYIAMRKRGDFILRLETADGKRYDYAVRPKDMQTTKVKMGKGLRARFFSWELISDGSDFDLESVAFVPMMATRRV